MPGAPEREFHCPFPCSLSQTVANPLEDYFILTKSSARSRWMGAGIPAFPPLLAALLRVWRLIFQFCPPFRFVLPSSCSHL